MPEQQRIVETLRATMLRCLLEDKPLPGTAQAVQFPDFRFIAESDTLFIADDHLTDDFSFDFTNKPLALMTEQDLRALAKADGDRFYVYFQPALWDDERVSIPLEVRLAPRQADVFQLSLGGVSAVFESTGEEWSVVEGPVVMAG